MSGLNQTFVESVGLMLVHSLWLLLIPATVLTVVLWLVPQKYSAARCNLALGTLGLMAVLPFGASSVGDMYPLDSVKAWERSGDEMGGLPADNAPDVTSPFSSATLADNSWPQKNGNPNGDVAVPEAIESRLLDGDAGVSPGLAGRSELVSGDSESISESDAAVAPVEQAQAIGSPTLTARLRPLLPWTVAIWFVGTLLMTLRLILGCRSSRMLRRHGFQPVSESIQQTFAELRERIQANSATRVVLSTLVNVPSVVGHFKPVVLLPMSAVTGLREEQLRAILAHELGHVRRWDYAINIVQTAIETVLFYHPAVWWVSRVVRDEREHCCDDIALKAGSAPAELALALVSVDAVRKQSHRTAFEDLLVTASDGGNLLRRVRRIANVRGDDGASRRSWVAGILVLVALGATASFLMPRSTVASDESTVAILTGEPLPIDAENVSTSEETTTEQQQQVNSGVDDARRAAPDGVPLPIEKFKSFAKFPPSGSGLRVKLDNRRWVEFNALASIDKVGGNDQKIFWRANGELIDPPDGFDPLTLVPDNVDGRMPEVKRELLIQAVGPKGMDFSLSCSGGAAYGRFKVPIDGEFEQAPINSTMNGIQSNHAYAEVKVTREKWEDLPLQGGDEFQIIIDEDRPSLFAISNDARKFAWKLDIQFEGRDPQAVGPMMVTDLSSRFGVPENLREKARDDLQSGEVAVFAFDKDEPLPKVLTLRRSRYDTVRFDNLSVFPGPHSAVRASVNGVPVSADEQPQLDPPVTVNPAAPAEADEEATTAGGGETDVAALLNSILLNGKVVDGNDEPVANCWVGMFVEPQFDDEGKSSATVFDVGPALSHQTRTAADGTFSIQAKKTHHVFDGSFWAVAPDGASGVKRLHAVWSYAKKNLTIKINDGSAVVRVVDQSEQPVADATVVLEAVQKPRSVANRLPVAVQRQQSYTTDAEGKVMFGGWPSVAIRGIAVTANGYGTQFLDSMRSSQWVDGDEPLTVKLQPTASLVGHMEGFDPQQHAGLKLQIETEQHDDRPPLNGRAIVDVNDDGKFAVDAIAAGRVTFASSLLPDSLTKVRFPYVRGLEAGENRVFEKNPQLVPAVVVRQRIIKSDTGEGIPDMELRVLWGAAVKGDGSWQDSKPTKTDADGWWTARVLPGTINVRISGGVQGYRGTAWFDGRNGHLGVEAQIPATEEIVTLPPEEYVPSKSMKGRLQYEDGSPAANWSAYGHPISWNDVGVGGVDTNKDGSFIWNYPVGYPPRLYNVSNREWMTEHGFKDRYVRPKVVSTNPFVLQIPEKPPKANAESKN